MMTLTWIKEKWQEKMKKKSISIRVSERQINEYTYFYYY